jgi:hypothetical protein
MASHALQGFRPVTSILGFQQIRRKSPRSLPTLNPPEQVTLVVASNEHSLLALHFLARKPSHASASPAAGVVVAGAAAHTLESRSNEQAAFALHALPPNPSHASAADVVVARAAVHTLVSRSNEQAAFALHAVPRKPSHASTSASAADVVMEGGKVVVDGIDTQIF